MSDRDWREYAYLNAEHWPEAIPWYGPKREYGPYSWGQPRHDNPYDVDTYPFSHPDAASIGDLYMGDVCPQCGVPLKYDQEVRNIGGEKGKLYDVSPDENPVPCYHPECYIEREATIHAQENASLDQFK